MKKTISFILTAILATSGALHAADSTFLDYQNYNHGYCPECSCYPCCCQGGSCDAAPTDCAAPCAQPTPCAAPCNVPTPCAPCAPVCGTECGISICAIGIAIAAVAAAGAIIIASSNGGSSSHLP